MVKMRDYGKLLFLFMIVLVVIVNMDDKYL